MCLVKGGTPAHTCRKIRIWGSQLLLSLSLTSPGAIIDVAWQILWLKNDVFDEILGCVGHSTSPEKKWAPVAIKIFYKYVPPCQAVCCFPTQGLKYCGALHHFRSDDTYARWEIGRLGSNLFWLNKKKRKVWQVIYPNRANDTKLNKFVGLTTHLSRANDNRK